MSSGPKQPAGEIQLALTQFLATVYSLDNSTYPLVMTNIAMENHHFSWENPLFQWPFSFSYVKLPEGNIAISLSQPGSSGVCRAPRLPSVGTSRNQTLAQVPCPKSGGNRANAKPCAAAIVLTLSRGLTSRKHRIVLARNDCILCVHRPPELNRRSSLSLDSFYMS